VGLVRTQNVINTMTDYELINVHAEDIEDWLIKVETSFDIKFVGNELIHIKTFGQLCDLIKNKIQLDQDDHCTSQQAFYKLRDAISSTLEINSKTISIHSLLTDILPRQSRRLKTKNLEKHLGFKLNILQPPQWITSTLFILFLGSIAGLFFNWQMGLTGLVFSFAGLWIVNRTGKEFSVLTVGQVAEKMTREHYLQSRRSPQTLNEKEIEKVLTDWFIMEFDLHKSKVTREAKFA
jgi:hypothetical protein